MGDVNDRRPTRDRREAPSDRPRRRRDEEKVARSRLAAPAAAAAGLRQVAELTGRETQGVVSLSPAEAGWVVGVEVVEDRRIPSSTDVLALYEAEIGEDGSLRSYRRQRRYARGKSDRGEVGS